MGTDSVFRFVAVRPPTITLPKLDPSSTPTNDAHADAVVKDNLAVARAAEPDETRARRTAAESIRGQSLIETQAGRKLLSYRAEADAVIDKLPERHWGAALTAGTKDMFADVLSSNIGTKSDSGEALARLRTSCWLTYYAGLLDPENAPYFEEANFWIRVLELRDQAASDDGSRSFAGIKSIVPAASLDLLRTPRPKDLPDAGELRQRPQEVAFNEKVAQARALEQLIGELKAVRDQRSAALRELARKPPAAADVTPDNSVDKRNTATREIAASGAVISTEPISVPRLWDPATDDLTEPSLRLLEHLGLSAETPLLRLIDELQLALARAAADLYRLHSTVQRHGRIHVLAANDERNEGA